MLPSRRPVGAPGGPAEAGTLADVMGYDLWLCCRKCLRDVRVSPLQASLVYGPDLELQDFRRRAVCKGCGAQAANLFVAERQR